MGRKESETFFCTTKKYLYTLKILLNDTSCILETCAKLAAVLTWSDRAARQIETCSPFCNSCDLVSRSWKLKVCCAFFQPCLKWFNCQTGYVVLGNTGCQGTEAACTGGYSLGTTRTKRVFLEHLLQKPMDTHENSEPESLWSGRTSKSFHRLLVKPGQWPRYFIGCIPPTQVTMSTHKTSSFLPNRQNGDDTLWISDNRWQSDHKT